MCALVYVAGAPSNKIRRDRMADHDFQSVFAPNDDGISGSGVTVAARLKAARKAAGLSLGQMSEQTRIPARMLELIEAGDFDALPAHTYATGFTRSYARALGLDEQEAVAAVREELGLNQRVETRLAPTFEPGDPARVPTARFAWLAAVAALAFVAAGLFLWRNYYAPAVSLPSILPDDAAQAAPSANIPMMASSPAGPGSGEAPATQAPLDGSVTSASANPIDAAMAGPMSRAAANEPVSPALQAMAPNAARP